MSSSPQSSSPYTIALFVLLPTAPIFLVCIPVILLLRRSLRLRSPVPSSSPINSVASIPPYSSLAAPRPKPAMSQTASSAFNVETVGEHLGIGPARWSHVRDTWRGAKESKPTGGELSEADLDAVCECMAHPQRPNFSQPVPLSQMVNILIEMWEGDGLYD